MVFESLVVDLLNRFLYNYVQNLDKNQLKIGIWGGDVVLNNLQLKQSALDELDLPVQTTYGHLGKLVLKIPWKNLYKAPVEATIENLYLLASPNQAVEYNAEKEAKKEAEAKKAELTRIEEAKKKEDEKDAPKIDKSFAEKLATQIINNVQIKINDIHIRYEDKTTTTAPFAFGITLRNLYVNTTDCNWQKSFMSEALNQVYKIAELEGLAVYFNTGTQLFSRNPETDYPQLFRDTIASRQKQPEGFSYILGPISSTAKLQLNPNPEADESPFTIPKVQLSLNMEKLAIGLMKSQYKDLIQLVENMDRMMKGLTYRQYRPVGKTYKGNYNLWWKFAMNSVLHDVRRRHKNWSWDHMIEHRNLLKTYSTAYKSKLQTKKPSNDIISTCDNCETKLDLFNLVIIRHRIEAEVKKIDDIKAKEVSEQKSWFGGWWSGSKSTDTLSSSETDIKKQVQMIMTSDEKERLYKAIGYQENAVPTELPEYFVATRINFELKMLEVSIKNDDLTEKAKQLEHSDIERIMLMQLKGVVCELDQRPAASAIKLQLGVKTFSVFGAEQENMVPIMAKSKLGSTEKTILDIMFETNPLDKRCDQRIEVRSRPLQIVYDAGTIIQLAQMFKAPKDLNISQLQDAAANRLENIKERSATGLQYAIEKHTKLEVNINLMPTYLIVPFGGLYKRNETSLVIIDMGKISVQTEPRALNPKDVASMASTGANSDDILKEMISQCYDRFKLDIQDIQVMVVKSHENWYEALTSGNKSEMHLLEPASILLSAHICVIDDDPRLPKTRITAELPAIRLSVTEERVLQAISIGTSIPLPESDETTPMQLNKDSGIISSSMSIIKFLDDKQRKKKKKPEPTPELTEEIVQFTDLIVDFVMRELSIVLYKPRTNETTPSDEYRTPIEEFTSDTQSFDVKSVQQRTSIFSPSSDTPDFHQKLLAFKVKQLEMSMVQRTYDMKVSLKLGGVALDQHKLTLGREVTLNIINTPTFENANEYLFTLGYTNAKKTAPEFSTRYNSTEQLIEINFTTLLLLLHQEGINELLKIASSFQHKLELITKETEPKDRVGTTRPDENAIVMAVKEKLPTISEEPTDQAVTSKNPKKIGSLVDCIKVKLIAKLDTVSVEIDSDRRSIAILNVKNLTTSVIMKSSYTEVSVKLQDINVVDRNPLTIHSTILSVVSGNAIACQIVLFNLDETSAYNSDDMKIDVSMGCVKIVFMNWFVQSVLSFLDNFQAAQKAIADASKNAADAAKQNMVEAYSKATRMKMNIRIKAPIIIVPVDSQSCHAICLDLGYLSITNFNTEIEVKDDEKSPAVIDEMKIELKDMKLSKVQIKTSDTSLNETIGSEIQYGLKSDVNILNPTSFVLGIQRNLSVGWYKERPELDVSGRLKSIELNLVATDYKMLMEILSKNMSEGADERKIPVVQPISPKRASTPSPVIQEDGDDNKIIWNAAVKKVAAPKPFGLDINSLNSPQSPEMQPKKKVDTFLKFAFQMDSIVVNIFTEENDGLASFGIYYLSLKGHKLVDDSMSTSIILCDVQLDDIRPNRENKITRFMKRREQQENELNTKAIVEKLSPTSTPTPAKSMIDIVCNMRENDMFVELRVSSFDLILSLDFLMRISKFFQLPEDESIDQLKTVAKTQSIASKPTVQVTPPPPKDDTKRMTIILNIEQPDIILIEKMDDINCHALIMNSEIAIRFRMIGERQVLKGDIRDLSLYMCEFNPSRRKLTKHFVLHPCALSLNGSTPEGKGLHLSLQVTHIRLCVSPGIIELLNKAMVTLTAQEKSALDEVKPLPDHGNIWDVKEYVDEEFWFIRTEEAEDVLCTNMIVQENKVELCIAEIPSIVLIIETGSGHQSIPMLYIETSMEAQIHNWSWQMAISSSLRLSMSYYNSTLALWEPLIEPNGRENANGLTEYGPWELGFSMEVDTNKEDADDEPTTKICVSSKEILEMTVTKTCLDVLQNLGKAFSEAIKPEGSTKPAVEAPYVVQNDTGFEITLNLVSGEFSLHTSHLPNSGYAIDEQTSSAVVFQSNTNLSSNSLCSNDVTTVKISPGGKAYLQLKSNDIVSTARDDASNFSLNFIQEKSLHVKIGDIDKDLILPVHKADERYFPLYRDTNKEPWGIVSDIKVEFGCTVITIHGVLQIYNHFTAPVTMYRMKGTTVHLVGEIAPNASFNVPLHAIYAVQKELHFSMQGYKISVQGISWKENPSDFKLVRVLQCDPVKTFEPFYMNAVRERKEIFHEVTSKYTMLSACYSVHLRPPLILKNTLPIGMRISVAGCSVAVKDGPDDDKQETTPKSTLTKKEDFLDYGEKLVAPGEALHLPTVKTSSRSGETSSYIVARLVQYLEKDWSCTTEIPSTPPEFTVWTFNSYDSVDKMSLELGVRYENRNGTLILSIYCPFWMVNKTGLMLSYRKSRKTEKNELSGISPKSSDESTNILYHPPEYDGPILFSFREKAFFGKKKASIRVDAGEWCDKFSLDVAGSSGTVNCKANNIIYQIAVHNTLTHNSLTKQIMFMPYFILINKAPFAIEVQEDQRPGDPWVMVKSDNSVPFWPKMDTKKMLRVKSVDDSEVARTFNYAEVQDTLLKLNNKYGGIHVDVHVTEGGTFITFNAYYPGDAPALIINHTNNDIKFWEKGNVNERIIPRNMKMLYTWSDPAGERKIVWNNGSKNGNIENDLRRDGVDQFTLSDDNKSSSTYWVSFLDGTQRVLLFTNSDFIANEAQSTSQLDKVNQEILIDIHGIGLSLVNNIKQCDVMYIGIASSGVIWEDCKKQRFKAMKIQECIMLEEKYQEFVRDKLMGKELEKTYFIDNEKIMVDFIQMTIKKSTERSIRRTFYPGLWLQMKTSPFQTQIHAKINRIQIDNQISDCIFPVVLAPVPPPKSVAATIELKPFIECSIVQRVIPHSDVKQFKYCRVLIQEFHIKVDLLFINELFEFLDSEVSDEESAKQFSLDLQHLVEPLSAHVQVHSQQEQKNFYDQLHLGPLRIWVSFSMAGSESKALPGILSTILQGVGVTLTDINGVEFRLAFFEREYCFLTQRQLVSECVTHYSGQAVKQLYVLVLGLDVIGNPYGLVVGITKGVEDLFYEPFQGAIQGPGEFAEGLVLGVRSLFGHTVGGAAGAVSKITGAMGKGIAALTFDKDYQKKRRDQMNKKPATLQEGLARSGKGLVMGVVDGVTGVFTKPISGAKSDGVEGFFKGLGKGAVGLVARPTAGVIDFASGSFEAVKRVAENSEDVNRLRSPRFLHSDGVVRPYNIRDAEGNKLLKEIDKGKYSNTDTFAHFEVIIEKHEFILLSDHRILYIVKNEIFGGWQVEWGYRWNEITSVQSTERGVEILLPGKSSKKIMGLFSSNETNKKIVLIPQKMRRDKLAGIMDNLKRKDN